MTNASEDLVPMEAHAVTGKAICIDQLLKLHIIV